MKRSEAIEYLNSLTDKQFVDFFYEATEGRRVFRGEIKQERLVLANASEDPYKPGQWNLVLLAVHDPKRYPAAWADNVPICQEAESHGYPVFSYAKDMVCPICRTAISGT